MASVNIDRSNKDLFYRYKMPKLTSKVEGKGNGIKTVIPNMEEIALSLGRPPSYPTKFFGCELGAQTQMDDKNSRYIVNGAHDIKTLEDLLDKFIKKFVLCQDCQNPETNMLIDKREDIWLDCKACGAHKKADMNHKLCVFILKNPPPTANLAPAGKPAKKSKEERRREKIEKAKNGRKQSDEDEDDQKTNGHSNGGSDGEKEKQPENEVDDSGLTFTPAIGVNNESIENGHTISDVNEEFTVDEETLNKARKEMAQSMNDVVKNLVVGGDDDAPEANDEMSDSYEIFANFVSSDHTPEEIISEMSRLSLKEDKALAVLVQVLFTERIMEELPKRLTLLKKTVKSEKAVKGLIGGIERLVGVTFPQVMGKFPLILKYLYDKDILEEDAIINWNSKISKKYVSKEIGVKLRKSAEPLIDWLKNAEEESD